MLLGIFFHLFSNCYGQITFERNDSLEGLQLNCCPSSHYILQTYDHGYLSAGSIAMGLIVNYFLEKLDSTGHIEWRKIFGYWGDVDLSSVAQTSDSGFIICGSPRDQGAPIGILKTDYIGNNQWVKYIGIGNGNLYGNSIKETMDGGYIIAGSKNFPGNWDAELIKLDSNGALIWSKAYGAQMSRDIFYDIVQTDDSGFLAIGSTDPTGVLKQIFIVRTNSFGDTLWTKIFQNGFLFSEGISITKTFDSGFVIAGHPKNTWNPGYGSLLFKLNYQGDLLWEKQWGNISDSLIIYSVKQTSDSSLILCGNFYYTSGLGCLIKTDSQGDTLWTKQLNGAGAYICESYDGGFALAGGALATVIKTDNLGNTNCNSTSSGFAITSSSLFQAFDSVRVIADTLSTPTLIGGDDGTPIMERILCNSLKAPEINFSNPNVELYPNPAARNIKIRSNSEISYLEIYNLVEVQIQKSNIYDSKEFEIDISDLPPSIYFIKLYYAEGSSTLKFIKE